MHRDYQSLEYIETWIKTGNQDLKIIRFKGKFEDPAKEMKIRVVLN